VVVSPHADPELLAAVALLAVPELVAEAPSPVLAATDVLDEVPGALPPGPAVPVAEVLPGAPPAPLEAAALSATTDEEQAAKPAATRPTASAEATARAWRKVTKTSVLPPSFVVNRGVLRGAAQACPLLPSVLAFLSMYAGHLDLTRPLVWTVDDALSPADCAAYVRRMREGTAEVAPIVGKEGPEVDLAVRNNTRVMWDDEAEADALLARVRMEVPPVLSGLRLMGANPRLRLYRYGPGERHGAHWDTVVELASGVRSLVTLVFYLNDGFEGGETDFPELERRVAPRAGRALLFQHRILHEATEVRAGEKLVLRTDVLYGP
jgi:prolyl 4-hydroxylase